MNFRFAIVIFSMFFSGYVSGQNISVLDVNGNPIPNVFVFNKHLQDLTNDQGEIILPEKEHIEISFQHISYGTITYSYVQIKEMGYKISLKKKCNILEEVELVGRTGKKKSEVFNQIETINISKIPVNQAQSTPELLERKAGVFVQKTQMGGGSPVVRGFEANKVLLMQDGVRLNNAIYRSGHLHNMLSIDDRALEKIDLVYGPGALNYGSDAIGGVLHFISKEPEMNSKSLNYFTSYASAHNGSKSYVDFNLSKDKVASLTSLGYSHFGDMKTGSVRTDKFPDFGKRLSYVVTDNGIDREVINPDPNLQIGTGYKQWNLSNKTRVIINDKLSWVNSIQYSSSSDVPRYDFLTEKSDGQAKYAEWSYGPQERIFIASTLNWYKNTKLFDQIKTILSFQKLKEERISRRFERPDRITNTESIDVYGATVDFIKNLKKDKITYGVDFQYNDLNSTAELYNIIDKNTHSNILTRYPNGENEMHSLGVYGSYYMPNLLKNLHFNTGLRVQNTQVNLEYDKTNLVTWPDEYYEGIRNQNIALTGSVALKWEPIPKLSINWMSASAFRDPNIDDIAKIRVKQGEIQMPDTKLIPEKSLNHELNLNYKPFENKNDFIDIAVYHTRLKDAIVRNNATFNGSETYISNGDTLNVIANQNANNAIVKGISLSSSFQLYDPIQLLFSFTKIVGEQKRKSSSEIRPLDHIPPAYGRVQLIYKKKKLSTQFSYNYYDDKPVDEYGGSSDNLENATLDGTPSYHIIHLGAEYALNDKIELGVGLRNILDTHYRLFSSGVSSTGRNLIVSVSGTF